MCASTVLTCTAHDSAVARRACGAVLSGWHNADPETGFAVAKGPEDGAPVDQAPSPGQKYLDAASKVLVAIINTAAKEGVGTVR